MFASYRWIMVLTAVLAVVFAASGWSEVGIEADRLPRELVLVALNTLPLLAVRRNPLVVVAVLAIAYPTWVALDHPTHELQSLPSLAAMYALGGWDRPVWVRALGLFLPVWMVGSAMWLWDIAWLDLAYVGVVFVVVWGLGVIVAGRRTYARELEARTTELEQARRELADRAVADERARIARELHDVIAHAMSVITVQAGVGGHLLEQRPEQAADALRVIERTGREALAEMRRMLAVLREPGTRESGDGTGSGGPVPDPQPGLADLPQLIRQTRDAGMTFSYRTTGTARSLPPGLELAAFRVTQEALTNAVKHAPRSRGTVTVTYLPDELEIEVANTASATRSDGDASHGHGLRGMAERVELYGGRLDTVADEAGFRVTARFPLEEAP